MVSLAVTNDEFVNELTRPLYVYRMGRVAAPRQDAMGRSGRTRMVNAQKQIDDLVLTRARAIQAERSAAEMEAGTR